MTNSPPPPQPPPPAQLPGAMVEVDDVSKWLGEVVAVNAVTLRINPGVTALLGPNGAGKSTLMRLIAGLTTPSRGKIRVLGENPRTHTGVTRRIGIAPQQEGIFEVQTAFEFVHLAGVLHRLDDPVTSARQALELVELDPDDTRLLVTYSKGMRQRVKLAQAIIHEPDLLLLDEPLNGLDPRQRAHMIEVVQRLGDEGRCVIVSSHVLEEVERFGSRVLVMAQGRLAAEGDFRAIRDLMDDRPHRIRIRASEARRLATELLGRGLCSGVRIEDEGTAEIETTTVHDFRASLMSAARNMNTTVFEVTPLDEDLESVFRYIVGTPS